jgi:hypothetical protein
VVTGFSLQLIFNYQSTSTSKYSAT